MTDYDQIIFRKYKIDHAVQQQFSHAESFFPIGDLMILTLHVPSMAKRKLVEAHVILISSESK